MDVDGDLLAGVADLFGGLTRDELAHAVGELAYKRGESVPDADAAIDRALERYELLVHERDGESLLVPGPTAYPELPPGTEDLPHILEVEPRDIDDAALAQTAAERFRADAARAVDEGDAADVENLLDVSYELDVWAEVDLAEARERLRTARE